jgi:hypothetical protein
MRANAWSCIVVIQALACSASPEAKTSEEPTTPMMAPPGAANGPPPAAGPSASDPGNADPPPAIGAAGSGATPGDDGAPDPDPGSIEPTEPTEPSPTGACATRQVSYSTPCHDEPDPCGLASGYPGDQYCLLPPAEGEGIQIHIGPDAYDDPAEIAKYVIQAGEEFNNSVLGHIPLDQDAFFDRITVQMRPGSHHWISSVVDGKPEERVYADTSCGGATQVGSIGGGQNLIYDNPPGGVPAPENEGLGRPLSGSSSLCMNLHAYNYSEEPQLREMWINVYFVPEAEVTQRAQGIGIVGGLGLSVAPGADRTLMYTETFSAPGRIIQLFGHRHVWTPRFAVWLNDDLIYDSWDWEESITFNYDSLTENPPINTEGKVDGATSGALEVATGDELTFACYIENRSDVTLRFANELYTAEMCNLWGSAVGTGLRATRF